MTITETQQLLKRLARLECRTCYGDELLMRSGEGDKPCLDCRDSEGQPTGLACPELTEPCLNFDPMIPTCAGYLGGKHCDHCLNCKGTGRTLKHGPALLVAALQTLKAPHVAIDWYDWWHVRVVIAGDTPTGYRDFPAEHKNLNEALLTAASKALAAALNLE